MKVLTKTTYKWRFKKKIPSNLIEIRKRGICTCVRQRCISVENYKRMSICNRVLKEELEMDDVLLL